MRVHYEVFGSGEPTVLLLPTWSIVHSRVWKVQVPYLARHCRVVTFDGRGNGLSDRPEAADAYAEEEYAADALAVLDATGTQRAVLVGHLLRGAGAGPHRWRPTTRSGSARVFNRPRPCRFAAATRAGPGRSTRSSTPTRAGRSSTATTGCGTTPASSSSSSREMFTEPHSTKQIEDCVGWGLETTPETLDRDDARAARDEVATCTRALRRVRCPVLVIHGRRGRDPALRDRAAALAELTRGGSSRSRARATRRTRATR